MSRVVVIVSLILACLTPAWADQKPTSLPSDSRIKQFTFDQNAVYRLDLHLKSITSVQFARGEHVQSILSGDSASFDVVRLKAGNVLSIKPKVANAVSNVTVFTDRRVYTFELVTVGDVRQGHRHRRNQAYRVNFVYPATGKVQEFGNGAGSGGKNFDYFAAGQGRFKPVEVFDNGKQTFFRFDENAPRPAIFKVDKDGKESIVNVRSNGNTIIVDSVNSLWTVRIGDEALCVTSGAAIKKLPRRLRKTVGIS